MRNAFSSTGWVIAPGDAGLRFAGTCFAFLNSRLLLTAAHCVAGYSARDVTVTIERDQVERGLEVRRINRHPRLDVAALYIDANGVFDPFHGVSKVVSFGDTVISFGYPEDTLPGGVLPVPRYFRGHIQRVFTHQSAFGYKYGAAELSFPAPAGLSGGPLALADDPGRIVGIVTENKLATTFLQSITEIKDEQRHYRESIHSTVEYGIAALLNIEESWLDKVANWSNREHG